MARVLVVPNGRYQLLSRNVCVLKADCVSFVERGFIDLSRHAGALLDHGGLHINLVKCWSVRLGPRNSQFTVVDGMAVKSKEGCEGCC